MTRAEYQTVTSVYSLHMSIALQAIQSNDLLRRLTNEQITQIIDYMVRAEYPKGHTLIKEGDDGDRFYILQKGKCTVTKVRTDS